MIEVGLCVQYVGNDGLLNDVPCLFTVWLFIYLFIDACMFFFPSLSVFVATLHLELCFGFSVFID